MKWCTSFTYCSCFLQKSSYNSSDPLELQLGPSHTLITNDGGVIDENEITWIDKLLNTNTIIKTNNIFRIN